MSSKTTSIISSEKDANRSSKHRSPPTLADLMAKFEEEDSADEDGTIDNEEDDAVKEENERVKQVMNANTSDGTKDGYWYSQRRFAVFLYLKSKSQKFGKKFAELLDPVLEDALNNVPRGKGSTARLKETALHHMKSASPSYQPIVLSKLKPEYFMLFLMSLTNTNAKTYMKSYGGHRSALTFLFMRCKFTASAEFLEELKQGMAGLKNTAAKARGETGGKLGEGKDPMSFELYRAICMWLIEDGCTESVFGHCFLTMTWNLMCRSKNTVKIRNEHIGWEGDAMTVQFAHSKTDQMGSTAGWKRHIYANPELPEVCPVLAFAKFRQTFPSADSGRLFSGDKQYDRFRKILKRILQKHESEVKRLGVDPKNIGVHSIRKGAATYCTSGTTAGVGFAAVCVRAGWSMGFKDRYLQYEAAGDQLCGRTTSGLDVNSHSFAISPPHFLVEKDSLTSSDDQSNSKQESNPTEDDVDDAISMAFGRVAPVRRLLCRFLLATLLFHKEWMWNHIDRSSRLFGATIFRAGVYKKIEPCVKVCLPWTNNNTVWRITFTGIPPAVTNFCYQRQQIELISVLPELLFQRIKALLDDRGIGGGNVSIEQLKEILLDPLSKRFDELDLLGPKNSNLAQPMNKIKQAVFRSVPKNYRLNTKLSCLAAWLNWHLGEEQRGKEGSHTLTPPWKHLKASDLLDSGSKKERSTARKTLSNLRSLCWEFDKAAGICVGSKPDVKWLTELFHADGSRVRAVLNPVAKTKKGRARRLDECHWETLAVELSKYNIKKQPERKRKQQPTGVASQAHHANKKVKKSSQKRKQTTDSDVVELSSDEENSGLNHQPGRGFHTKHYVHGPLPEQLNVGGIGVTKSDCRDVRTQGCMITGCAVQAYLNRLSRKLYKFGARRVEETFWHNLQHAFTAHGSSGAWKEMEEAMKRQPKGSHCIDFERDPLIFFPAFVGPIEAGHWTMLICDRTRHKPGVLVFIDSLPNYNETLFNKLQTILPNTPLCRVGTKWIRARMPKQGRGTNDCAVWACTSAAAYAKALERDGILAAIHDNQDDHDISRDVDVNTPVLNEVEIEISSTSASKIGALGRQQMIDTYENNHCNLDHEIFNHLKVHFS